MAGLLENMFLNISGSFSTLCIIGLFIIWLIACCICSEFAMFIPPSPCDCSNHRETLIGTLQSDKSFGVVQFDTVHDCTCKPPLYNMQWCTNSKTGIQGPSLTRPPRPKSPPDPIGVDEAAPELGGADAAALELVVLVLHSSSTICQSRCCPCMSLYAVTQGSSGLASVERTHLAVVP